MNREAIKQAIQDSPAVMLSAVASVALIPAEAFVLGLMWKWFVSPMGVHSINAWHITGIACMLMMMKGWIYGYQYPTFRGMIFSLTRLAMIAFVAYYAREHMGNVTGFSLPKLF